MSGILVEQRFVVRAVPRLVEMKLLVQHRQFLLSEEGQQVNAPAQMRPAPFIEKVIWRSPWLSDIRL